jgi:hypothetical protein
LTPSPGWLAVIEHVPVATIVTVATLTVQTDCVVEVKITVRPEVAVALSPKGDTPKVTLLSVPNEMVWGGRADAWVTVIDCPRIVMCAVLAAVTVLAVKVKGTTPPAGVPIVSQFWSLAGAKTPVRDCVDGITWSFESLPAA